MYKVIIADKLQDKIKEEDIIAIVRDESVRGLRSKLNKNGFLKTKLQGASKCAVVVCNQNQINDTINNLVKSSQSQKLRMIVSKEIGSIYFNVPSQFKTLMIFRCGHGGSGDGDNNKDAKVSRNRVRINERSTFAGVRIGDWTQAQRANKLYIGEGVGVPTTFDHISINATSSANVSSSERDQLQQNIQAMRNTDMGGKWWNDWKGPIAAALGIVSGAGTFAMASAIHATKTGVFINMKYGFFALKMGAVHTKVAAMVTAAGTGVLLGAGVAAAAYFIPWDDFFGWLGNMISRFFSWLWRLWQEFMAWISDKVECLRSHVAARMKLGQKQAKCY